MAIDIPQTIGAIAALGLAAYGLVDASKPFWGGASNFGFGHIEDAVEPFKAALAAATGSWQLTLHNHWLNGTALELQKAVAKSLIRLGLSPDNAAGLAAAGHVSPAEFVAAVQSLHNGTPLTPAQVNLFGRFDAAVDAALDAGYERADQKYRNSARTLAGAVAIVLSVWGSFLLHDPKATEPWGLHDLMTALWVGAVAVPLAPIAKDLASSLSAAMGALKAVRGGS